VIVLDSAKAVASVQSAQIAAAFDISLSEMLSGVDRPKRRTGTRKMTAHALLHEVTRCTLRITGVAYSMPRDAQLRGRPSPTDYFSTLITPTPIVPRSRCGSFKRAFSACALVLNGLESGVN